MTLRFVQLSLCLTAGFAVLLSCNSAIAQTTDSALKVAFDLPEAPMPQQPQAPAPAPTAPASSAPASSAAGTASSSQDAAKPDSAQSATDKEKIRRETAERQLKQEKTQRIGVLPNFNASYISDAVPLTAGQKFRLMFATEKDPATIGFSMFVALIGQAEGSHPAYGGGIGGYGKRFGQNYADTFDGAFWGNAVLPALWHQDPRYFRLGTGSVRRRIFYALSTNVRAKHDGTGKWEPNYSNLIGNVISGGISNLYLPADERGVGSTFEGAATVTAEGGIGSMLEEFWPDVVAAIKRHHDKKMHPADVDKVAPAPPSPASAKPDAQVPQSAPQN